MNEFSYFSSREKILKNLDRQNNHINIINNSKKEINSLKNQNNSKGTSLLKTNSKTKILSKQNIYTNTTNTNSNANNTKKSHKTSINITNTSINNNTSNKIDENKKEKNDTNNNINNYLLNVSDKIKIFEETNPNNNTNSDNKDFFNGTEEDNNHFNGEYFNELNNLNSNINPNNKRNYDYKMNYDGIKALNSLKSYQRNNESNNIEKSNNLENKNKNDIAYQTYSGYFRNNLIKVNMIEKENKNGKNINQNNNINGNTYDDNIASENVIFNSSKKNFFNRNNNLIKSKNSIHNSINNIKKNDKKNLYIKTDFKDNKKYKKNSNIFNNRYTKNNEKRKNDKNILIQNYCESNNKIQSTNDEANNNSNNEDKNNGKQKEKNIKDLTSNISYKSNLISPNNCKLNKNSSLNSTATNSQNYNIFPLSRDNSTTYIKKKSTNMKIYHTGWMNDYISNTNRIKHKKNCSISQSCYNTQRNSKFGKINSTNKSSNKDNYLYSPKNNQITNNRIIMPEYKMKLESIKSRVSNLLNVYSLLALKNINVLNDNKELLQNNIISNNNEC